MKKPEIKRPKKITNDAIRAAIAKLKRRKNIGSDADIHVKMIAAELGCSRQMLYKKEFDKSMDRFKKIKKKNTGDSPKKGTIAYFKHIASKRAKDLDSQKSKLKLALDQLIDQEVLLGTIEDLREENERLHANSDAQKESLIADNHKLRKKLLESNSLKRNINLEQDI